MNTISIFSSTGPGLPVRMGMVALGLVSCAVWTNAAAVPAFARQTGLSCNTCHYQAYPALNAFGRAFKADGYTLTKEAQVKDDDLSLPVTLNTSLVTKFRYQKTNGNDKTKATNQGEAQIPDEAAFLIGGRAGEHVGFLLEFATFGEADTGSGDVTGTTADTGTGEFSLFGSFKVPFTYKVGTTDLAVIPFTTDAGGASYGFEVLNTGAQRFIRVGEDRKALMAQQFVGLGAGAAEGLAFVAANELGFVNVSLWAPKHGSFAMKKLAPYARAAFTPKAGGWDLGFGAQYFSGEASEVETTTGTTVTYVTEGWALDAQAQGSVGPLPLGVYAAYATAPTDALSIFNTKPNDLTAWSLHGQLGVVPKKATVILGYLSGDTGATANNEDNAMTLGGTYQLAQNVQLQLNHVEFSGSRYDVLPATGDRRTTLMLFSAF